MTFSDDDLKEVKETSVITIHELHALLARLEAAEKVMHRGISDEEMIKAYETWRKTAGK